MIHLDTHILIRLLAGDTTLGGSTIDLLSEVLARSELAAEQLRSTWIDAEPG